MSRILWSAHIVAPITLSFLSGVALAAPLSVTEAVVAAQKSSPAILEQEARIKAAEYRLSAARILFSENPEVEAEAGRRQNNSRSKDWVLRLSHPLELGLPRGPRVEAAEREFQSQKLRLSWTRNIVAGSVRTLFHRIRALNKNVEIVDNELRGFVALQQATEQREVLGDVAPFEVRIAKSERILAEKRLAEARIALSRELQNLNTELGLAATAPTEIGPYRPAITESAQQGIRNDLQAFSLEKQAAADRISAARRAGLPTVRIWGGIAQDETDRIIAAGVSVPLPIYNQNASEVADAMAIASEREAEFARLRAEANRDLATARIRFESAQNVYRTAREALGDDSAVSFFEEVYRSGKIGLTDYLISLRQQYELERNINEAELELFTAWEQWQTVRGVYADED